jgi:alpha-ketoglutarate-dependent taurine dioxygenase
MVLVFANFQGRSWDVKSMHDSKNIAYTSLKLGLHMDLLYFESPPGLQFLHSLENSVVGGESIFLDSFMALKILKSQFPQYYQDLSTIPITYHYKNDGHDMMYTRPLIQKSPFISDQVFYSPPFQGYLNLSVSESFKFYTAMSQFSHILDDTKLIYQSYLKPGTCVVFANRRVLHGRQVYFFY